MKYRNVTLESLIDEGKDIGNGIIEKYTEHYLSYQTWSKTVIRFLRVHHSEDIVISDFENLNSFFILYPNKNIYDGLLAVLESLKAIPNIVSNRSNNQHNNTININNNLSQAQAQTQSQDILTNLLTGVTESTLTVEQYKEFKDILEKDEDCETKKLKIMETIQSWGTGVSSSILANILTNPQMWSGF